MSDEIEVEGTLFDLVNVIRLGEKQDAVKASESVLEALLETEPDEEGNQLFYDDFVVDVGGVKFTVSVIFSLGEHEEG